MSGAICGNMIGGAAPLRTLILEDENGNQLVGVVTDSVQVLTANASTDIREGTVAVTDEGIVTGGKKIPAYHTYEGAWLILAGNNVAISGKNCDYTKLQAIVCAFNSSLSDSVSAEKVAINDNVYNVLSTDIISTINKDVNNGKIEFGITNDSSTFQVVRYFYYKEIY